VFDQAAPDQGQFGHRAVQRPFQRRGEEVAHQPRQKGRHIGRAIMRLRGTVQRVLQQLCEIPRKHIRENRGAFDHPGISIAGFLAGEFMPVDQHHVASPLLQMQRGADADHARAQHHDIGLQFRHPALRKLNVTRS
jgi:hypothetical protein